MRYSGTASKTVSFHWFPIVEMDSLVSSKLYQFSYRYSSQSRIGHRGQKTTLSAGR